MFLHEDSKVKDKNYTTQILKKQPQGITLAPIFGACGGVKKNRLIHTMQTLCLPAHSPLPTPPFASKTSISPAILVEIF
jgi:hypothetical protein